MKILAHSINGPSISLEPETEAERFQLNHLIERLRNVKADWNNFVNPNESGITIKLKEVKDG